MQIYLHFRASDEYTGSPLFDTLALDNEGGMKYNILVMPHIELAAEKLFEIFGMPVTNTLLTGWIVVVLLTIVSFLIYGRVSLVPAFLQNILEIVIEKFVDTMEGLFGSKEKAEKYFPVVATIFLFILLSNWLGIFPGVGSIEFDGKPLFRSAASDLNFTLALAVSSVLLINIFGVAALGVWKHIGKFISFKGPIDFFVGILELVSEVAKLISFAFRLFGNVFAGEVLLVITAFLIPYFIPVPFLLLEIFVGFIQALVFSMLTMVFISIAVAEHH
jgi:F-type H+-transporting ATPase subunit a